ncbi:dipeptide/oligopeptide/nickel ABC transporter permease/ATP-binding protein [Embleya scabrispora]|uniref:dipeptide/oligopeptide/nickel ABC transporter permease/ATP-binding protein n=1 Tax=Embleya scabrispora TaxID=159449 RepID=UPI0003A5FBDE|nr:dipeptide/oligopeptide/nickel ABC transporter permease/ATP-binding protein [Embleya scabrispora]MYS81445.1 ATP-binding cassette domain-containing protein [Streptomyces sp. SID5474]
MSNAPRLRLALRTPLGITAAVASTIIFLTAIFGPMLLGDTADRIDTDAIGQHSGTEHLFGTDALGRDIAARVVVATRLTLELTLFATLIAVVGGLVLGVLPAVLGRRAGRLITATVNLLVAFPGLLFVLFLAVIFGVGTFSAAFAIGLGAAPSTARLVQNLTASIAGTDYVAAARILGVGRFRIIVRHILPNIAEPVALFVSTTAAGILVAFSGLSFLGLGVQPPDYDWGRLLNEQLDRVMVDPMSAVGPGSAIVLTGITFGLIGEVVAKANAGRTAPQAEVTPEATSAAPAEKTASGLLNIDHLQVRFAGHTAVHDVCLTVDEGEAVGIVGESGSGKSLTALAAAGLVPHPGRVSARSLRFGDRDLNKQAPKGTSMAMVFQDPMASLNPALTVGRQLAEVAEVHHNAGRAAALTRAVSRLGAVGIINPELRVRKRPHEFSGGMRQRVMIAMGLMGEPRLIIADEPTTALDVTVQAQVLALLRDVRTESGAALLLISHDIAVVSQVCDRVVVMYAGRIVEELPVGDLADGVAHPYSAALIGAVPSMTTDRDTPLATIPGRPPQPGEEIVGCPFAPRCARATDRCRTEEPVLEQIRPGRRVACWDPITTATHELEEAR